LTDYVEINSLIKTESDQKLSIVEKEKWIVQLECRD
jgi:hypothetical protein